MKDFLLDILSKLVELTQVSQEFHRNVKGHYYFCLHNSFQEDYEEFFKLQDVIAELCVQKFKVAHIQYTHEPTPEGMSAEEMVNYYLKLLKGIRSEIEDKDLSFGDADTLNEIIEYVDVKIMKYSHFLEK